MVDEDGPGAILSLEEVQALGPVEEATPVVISDSRSRKHLVFETVAAK
jgi:hypothetical protein